MKQTQCIKTAGCRSQRHVGVGATGAGDAVLAVAGLVERQLPVASPGQRYRPVAAKLEAALAMRRAGTSTYMRRVRAVLLPHGEVTIAAGHVDAHLMWT